MGDKADKCQKSDIGGAQGGDGSVTTKVVSHKREGYILYAPGGYAKVGKR
jgi:hypothetical protein